MSEHHYVVVYDEETNTFHRDVAAAAAAFPQGFVYDKDKDEWRDPVAGREYAIDIQASERLTKLLEGVRL